MNLSTDETELLDASRSWPETQRLFMAGVDQTRRQYEVAASWYDRSFDGSVGACCFIQQGSLLEELVGDFVVVTLEGRKLYLYCVGGGPIETEIAVTQRAFIEMAPLWKESVPVYVQATQ